MESAEFLLKSALGAISGPSEAMMDALDALPAAIYLTDIDGNVTHYNRACVPFAGRTPRPGRDRWCVTWKLFTAEGEALPHDRCPMAVAIKQGREIRGVEAWAERPDGSRVRFLPFPTLLFDDGGNVIGAVNLLIDVTDRRRADDLRDQAARCRRLSSSVLDRRTLDALNDMANEYEAEAERLARLN
ncbi:PAS domain-containing protein [Sphingomonas sp. LB-2]|uniref:PAS domain-containing protein n=1 Tax=Sphingomonas caeni TaxID=2984949 RepID=UPI002231F03D|nr:PAS domain-containing protein [Sphingomonas caeni]MCW3848801.1 PAS domain-containing protein [Sphingomonas caeni]